MGNDGYSRIIIDGPREDDKRPVIVISPGTEGTFTFITGRADDPNAEGSSGRGEGNQFYLNFDSGPDTKQVVGQFVQPVELYNGRVGWKPIDNWDFIDEWSLFIRVPATETTPNGSNEGNCNLYNLGGTSNLIIPAPAGNGTHDITYTEAVPVPDGYDPDKEGSQGFWNVSKYWDETLTPVADPNTPNGLFNLYDFQIDFYFVKNEHCGFPSGEWTFQGSKAEWISTKWQLIFKVTRNTTGNGKIGGEILVYREHAEEY